LRSGARRGRAVARPGDEGRPKRPCRPRLQGQCSYSVEPPTSIAFTEPARPAKGLPMSKIVTRLFESFSDAQHAVIELERIGVPHGDISLVSHKDDKHGLAHVREPRDDTAGEAAAQDGGIGAAARGARWAAGGV